MKPSKPMTIKERIKMAEDGLPVPAYRLREAEALIESLKARVAELERRDG